MSLQIHKTKSNKIWAFLLLFYIMKFRDSSRLTVLDSGSKCMRVNTGTPFGAHNYARYTSPFAKRQANKKQLYLFSPKKHERNKHTESESEREKARARARTVSSALIMTKMCLQMQQTNQSNAKQSKAFDTTSSLFSVGQSDFAGQRHETPIRIAPDTDVVDTSERKQSGWINSPAVQRASNSFQTDSKEVTNRHIEKRNSIGIYLHKQTYYVRATIRGIYIFF